MNRVLVSQRLVEDRAYPEVREALDIRWGDFFRMCGILPIPVAASVPAENYFKELKLSGVLLTGGNDLSIFNSEDRLSQQRDAVESSLIGLALKNKLPVVGVCRGMQILSHYHGFSLQKKQGHVIPSHRIQLDTGTYMGKTYGATNLDVNSYHHYCVTELKSNFRIVAWMPEDQTVEAFEHESQKIYALMWHPERVNPFSPRDIHFFKTVFSQS